MSNLIQLLCAPKSQNAKLGSGLVATTYRPVGDAATGCGTCPSGCMLIPGKQTSPDEPICYTKGFLVDRQQQASRNRFDSLDRLLTKGIKLVRLHTSGDFFCPDGEGGYKLDMPYVETVIAWCFANPDVKVWTYTHDVTLFVQAGLTYNNGSFPSNLHLLASVDTLEQRAFAKAHGFKTARVFSDPSDKVDGETFCPYDLNVHKGRKGKNNGVTCAKCTLCFNHNHKKDIGFVAQ